jgi:chromosome segregation ATPase
MASSLERWEKAVDVRDKQLLIVSVQNEQLRASVSRLEAQLQNVASLLEAKERQFQAKVRDVQRREDQLKKLKALEDSCKGKEKAIEVTAAQNGELLSLLGTHEDKGKELAGERTRLLEELAATKLIHETSLRRFAEVDAWLRVELSELRQQHGQLEDKYAALEAKHQGFETAAWERERYEGRRPHSTITHTQS